MGSRTHLSHTQTLFLYLFVRWRACVCAFKVLQQILHFQFQPTCHFCLNLSVCLSPSFHKSLNFFQRSRGSSVTLRSSLHRSLTNKPLWPNPYLNPVLLSNSLQLWPLSSLQWVKMWTYSFWMQLSSTGRKSAISHGNIKVQLHFSSTGMHRTRLRSTVCTAEQCQQFLLLFVKVEQ